MDARPPTDAQLARQQRKARIERRRQALKDYRSPDRLPWPKRWPLEEAAAPAPALNEETARLRAEFARAIEEQAGFFRDALATTLHRRHPEHDRAYWDVIASDVLPVAHWFAEQDERHARAVDNNWDDPRGNYDLDREEELLDKLEEDQRRVISPLGDSFPADYDYDPATD